MGLLLRLIYIQISFQTFFCRLILYPDNFCLNFHSVGEDFDEVEDDADIDEIDQQEVSNLEL